MILKTVKQIKNKIQSLKNKLEKKQLKENFGEKEQRELDDFIGDVWEYDYCDRMIIISLTKNFFEWCYNYIKV